MLFSKCDKCGSTRIETKVQGTIIIYICLDCKTEWRSRIGWGQPR